MFLILATKIVQIFIAALHFVFFGRLHFSKYYDRIDHMSIGSCLWPVGWMGQIALIWFILGVWGFLACVSEYFQTVQWQGFWMHQYLDYGLTGWRKLPPHYCSTDKSQTFSVCCQSGLNEEEEREELGAIMGTVLWGDCICRIWDGSLGGWWLQWAFMPVQTALDLNTAFWVAFITLDGTISISCMIPSFTGNTLYQGD